MQPIHESPHQTPRRNHGLAGNFREFPHHWDPYNGDQWPEALDGHQLCDQQVLYQQLVAEEETGGHQHSQELRVQQLHHGSTGTSARRKGRSHQSHLWLNHMGIWMDMDGYGWIWGYMDGYNGHLNLEIKRHLKSTGGWRFHITQYSHSPLERLWYLCVLSRPSFQPSALLWHARRVQRKAAETCKRKAKAENCHNKMHSTWQQLGLAFVSEKLPWHFLNQLSKQK